MLMDSPKRIINLNKSKFYCILEEKKDYIQDSIRKWLNHYLLYEFKDEEELNRFIKTKKTTKKVKYYIGKLSDFENYHYTVLKDIENNNTSKKSIKLDKTVSKTKTNEANKKKSSKEKEKNSKKEYCVVVDIQDDDIVLLNVIKDFELYVFKDKKEKEDFIKSGKTNIKKEKQRGLISDLSNYTVVRITKDGKVEKINEENLVTIKNLEYYSIIHIYPSMSRYLISSTKTVISDSLFNYKDYKANYLFQKSSEHDFIDYEKNIENLDVVKLSNQMITFDSIKRLSVEEEEHLFLNIFNEPRILGEDDKAYFEYNENLYKNNLETIKENLEKNQKENVLLALKQFKEILNSIGALEKDGSIKEPYIKVFENKKNK